jgi:hypothetical protein
MTQKTSIDKFVIIEKGKANKFPSAPGRLLLADVNDELTGEEHDWNPIEGGAALCNWMLFGEKIFSLSF